jgi:hypothetical protein
VFKGKRFNSELMNGATFGARGEMSDSGWSNGELFSAYLKEHFLPYARSGTDDSQVILLLFDGHSSHVSPSLIKWARSRNLILFCLPAHSSHFLQPLDVSLFGPFKTFYYSECSSFMQKNIGQVITRYDMCQIACKAYLKAMTPINIQAGFRKTGIYPLSKDVIPMEKLFPAEGFRKEEPIKKVKALRHGKEAVEEFLQKKTESTTSTKKIENVNNLCQKCNGSVEVKKKMKKPKPSGRAITEDSYFKELEKYQEGLKGTPSSSHIDLEDKENETPKKKPKSKKNPKKSLKFGSPKPSTSGTSTSKSNQAIPVDYDNSDSEFEEKIADEDLCCVCKQWSPPYHNDHPDLKIITWAYCDNCSHCVHLKFCTPVRVVRRLSTFLCPCCDA